PQVRFLCDQEPRLTQCMALARFILGEPEAVPLTSFVVIDSAKAKPQAARCGVDALLATWILFPVARLSTHQACADQSRVQVGSGRSEGRCLPDLVVAPKVRP